MTEPTGRLTLARARAATSPSIVGARVRATPANIAEIRRLLVAFAAVHDAAEPTLAKVALAVSEAMTNAVLHAYGGDGSGWIDVAADIERGALEIVIADEGAGMRAAVRSDGLGLGLGLMARSAARFTVRDREPAGTEVWMRFELP